MYLPCVVDASKISFGSMLHLSNYGKMLLNGMHLLRYLGKEQVDFVHPWYSNRSQLGLAACSIYLGSVPKCSIYVHYFINCVYL